MGHQTVDKRLEWAVRALAQPSEIQRSLYPQFVLVAEELALDWHHWYSVARSEIGGAWTPTQARALASIDDLLDQMSGPDQPQLWVEPEGREWSKVRELAAAAIAVFGWPEGPPPSSPDSFIRAGR